MGSFTLVPFTFQIKAKIIREVTKTTRFTHKQRRLSTASATSSTKWLHLIAHLPISYLHRATFQDGDLHVVHIYMHSLQIRDCRLVEAVFIVRVHLKVWQRWCAIARFRHHIAAVAHEVVTTLVKRGVVGITRSYACGCICRQEWKRTNSCQRSYCHRCDGTGLKGWKLIDFYSVNLHIQQTFLPLG